MGLPHVVLPASARPGVRCAGTYAAMPPVSGALCLTADDAPFATLAGQAPGEHHEGLLVGVVHMQRRPRPNPAEGRSRRPRTRPRSGQPPASRAFSASGIDLRLQAGRAEEVA
jgi:hypothetical protein